MSLFDTLEQTVRDRQPSYPPEQSSAGTNTFTVKGCKAVGYTPGYCVCLHKLKAFERDKGLSSYPECERAIKDKACPAIGMRQEEQVAGQSLYYVDRTLLREEMDKTFAESARLARHKPAPAPVVKPEPIKAAVAKRVEQSLTTMPTPEIDGYAAAINAAIKETAVAPAPVESKPEPKVDAPSPSSVPKGLSFLEIARLQMGKTPTGA